MSLDRNRRELYCAVAMKIKRSCGIQQSIDCYGVCSDYVDGYSSPFELELRLPPSFSMGIFGTVYCSPTTCFKARVLTHKGGKIQLRNIESTIDRD